LDGKSKMRPIENSNGNLHLKDCSYTRNGKKYPYYAIAESVYKNGKRQKRILKTLHSLSTEEVASYRYMLNCINSKKITLADMNDVIFEGKKDFLNVSLFHSIWERFEFGRVFTFADSNKILSTAHTVEILTLSKLLNPASHVKTVDWFQQTLLSEILKIDPDKFNGMKIFHELSLIHDRKNKLESHLVDLSQRLGQNEFRLYFIDGTTTFFEGNQCPLARSGKDKTHGYKTHMILILLLTDKNGYPCAWDVYDGRKKEVSCFQELANRLVERYKIKNVIFCFDRGFASEDNFALAKLHQFNFISGIDSNQIESVFSVNHFTQETRDKLLARSEELHQIAKIENKKRDKKRIKVLSIDGFYTTDGDRFYKDLGVIEVYRYVAGFSAQVYQAQQKNREAQQISAFLKICQLNNELIVAKKDRDLEILDKKIDRILEDCSMKLIIEYEIIPIAVTHNKKTIQSAKVRYLVNQDQWAKAALIDGIFIYITDLVKKNEVTGDFLVSAHDIVQHYKAKNIIEEDFRKLKHVIDIRPLFVRLEEHVHAHISVCILAQFINVYLEQTLKPINLSLLDFYTLLERSSSVAYLKTQVQTHRKIITTQPLLKRALEVLGYSQILPAEFT
jgi:transposase